MIEYKLGSFGYIANGSRKFWSLSKKKDTMRPHITTTLGITCARSSAVSACQ